MSTLTVDNPSPIQILRLLFFSLFHFKIVSNWAIVGVKSFSIYNHLPHENLIYPLVSNILSEFVPDKFKYLTNLSEKFI